MLVTGDDVAMLLAVSRVENLPVAQRKETEEPQFREIRSTCFNKVLSAEQTGVGSLPYGTSTDKGMILYFTSMIPDYSIFVKYLQSFDMMNLVIHG